MTIPALAHPGVPARRPVCRAGRCLCLKQLTISAISVAQKSLFLRDCYSLFHKLTKSGDAGHRHDLTGGGAARRGGPATASKCSQQKVVLAGLR